MLKKKKHFYLEKKEEKIEKNKKKNNNRFLEMETVSLRIRLFIGACLNLFVFLVVDQESTKKKKKRFCFVSFHSFLIVSP